MPIVSILLPCFNAAARLEFALESLASQTLRDFEIVAVDDGSTDETRRILKTWSAKEPRLRVIDRPHQGLVAALQTGLAACRAPLVARMDCDDWAYPQRLERQIRYLEKDPRTTVVGSLVRGTPVETLGEGFKVYIDWLNSLVTPQDIRREFFVESPVVHPSVCYRKEAVLQAGGYQDHGWAEDYDLWMRLYLAGARFAKVPEILLDWRESSGRLTRTDSRYSLENFLRAKAHYLARGPLLDRNAVFIWGAGMMGRRISKHLERQGAPLAAFIDIDPKKIGRTRRGHPILAPEALPSWWSRYTAPVLLAAVGARGARVLIRSRLQGLGLEEGQDWWGVA